MDKRDIKRDLEAILFVWGDPVQLAEAAEAFGISQSEAQEIMRELCDDYEKRGGGLMIRKIGNGYQICTRPECEEMIRSFCTPVKVKKLSNAAMEVLAVIAYRQPVARSQIDAVRGVKSDRVLEGLIKRGLVSERGRGKGLGRPILYGTTDLFLEKFGISSLKDLPRLENESEEEAVFQQITMDV